jgi:hypothetical protein
MNSTSGHVFFCLFFLSGIALGADNDVLRFRDAASLPEKCGLPLVVEELKARTLRAAPVEGAFERTQRQKQIRVGNVRVHYDTTGRDAAAMLDGNYQPIPGSANRFADSVASIANRVWAFETAVLGYLAPPPDGVEGGGPEYDIYVRNLGSTYGSTYTETPIDNVPDGGRFTSYLEVDNDFVFVTPQTNRGLPSLRVTLAHELHHAIQLGSYGLWYEHTYYYEISSTWIEDVAYTEVNDYYQYLFSTQSQFATPQVPFTTSSLIAYSRGIWGHFVAAKYGRDAVRRSWELMQEFAIPPVTAIDEALREEPYGTSLADAFTEWSLWNYFTGTRATPEYYPEGEEYPEISELISTYTPPADTMTTLLPSLAAAYRSITSAGAPLTLVTSNISWNQDPGRNDTVQSVTYLLSDQNLGAGYEPTLSGIYVKRDVEDPFDWSSWAVVNGLASVLGGELPVVADEAVFPHPFVIDGTRVVNIPLGTTSPVTGDLRIYSSDMRLVFLSEQIRSRSERGLQVLQWDGHTTTGERAASGVYVYVISLPDRSPVTGKLAVIGE